MRACLKGSQKRYKMKHSLAFYLIGYKSQNNNLLQLFSDLDGRLNDFLNLAGELRIRVKGVGDYHRILLRAQASRSFSSLSGSEEMRMLESIYNEHLKQFYDNQIFFRYVFEGFVNIQSFNLRTSEILLVDTKGETQIKPISTFSTGQKAFAFSIAMMSIVFARHSKNKVLILDEFGALLDFMREDVLIKQIQLKIVDQNFADKVVIILPVRTGLETELENLTSQLKTASDAELEKLKAMQGQVQSRLNQLDEMGYYQFEQDNDEHNSDLE